jgi:EAL domain-containing protein (putative c-di-GMP-specific phosphodiesterase class I)
VPTARHGRAGNTQMAAQVVADGIETVDELKIAQRAGAEYCQGYLLGKPNAVFNGAPWPGLLNK